jgi:hypothetical protein
MDHARTIEPECMFDDSELPVIERPSQRHLGEHATTPDPLPIMHPPLPRRFAGFTYGQLAIGALLLLATIWGMWTTSRIMALEERKVVSVRLASIVNDFVSAEARSGTPPEELGNRTRAFMLALDTVLKKRAASGQVVLVGEAVVAASVPDVTADVLADLSKVVTLPIAAAMPPAMPPVPSLQPVSPPMQSRVEPGSPVDPNATPFGPSPAPVAGSVGQ